MELFYLLQVFDIETASCIQDPDGFQKIAINPYIVNLHLGIVVTLHNFLNHLREN